jgi:hypothetical protein
VLSILSLKPQEADWRQYVEEHCSNDMLVANSLAAAAFLTYCRAMNADCRSRLGEFFITICEHHSLPLPPKKLFKNMSLMEFLEKPVRICVASVFHHNFTCLTAEDV